MSYKERRDKVAEAHYEKRAKLFDVNDFTREVIAVESYKVGFDAGRADTLNEKSERELRLINLLIDVETTLHTLQKEYNFYTSLSANITEEIVQWQKAREE